MTKMPFIGIDLGTTFSAIAHINEHGVPEMIENAEGERTTPSAVLFDGDEIIVGSYAKENAVVYPGQVAAHVKRHMGDKLYHFEYRGRIYSASEISSFILKKVKQDAEERLGRAISEAVITVPAYFGDPQRRATLEAGELAGLKVSQLINEPTAAAYAYGLHKSGKDQRALVFDLGGGTFDVTVVEISGDLIEVKATDGEHHLGGKDWDEAMVQYLAEEFQRKFGLSPYVEEQDYQALKEKALATKISLSLLPKVNVIYGCQGRTLKEEISREKFEEFTLWLVDRCRMLTAQVLQAGGYQTRNIDVVLMAGGSTRMPMIALMLKEYFGREPSRALNPDECVAMGAAVKAALLQQETWALPGKMEVWALPCKIKDVNVTSHSFGLAVLKEGELFNSIIIPKNTPYPMEESRSDYSTSYDNQETLDLPVLEGEAEDPRDCDLVEYYQIYKIAPRPAGETRLQVTYRYNQNQIVEVKALDLKDKRKLPLRRIEDADLNQLTTFHGMEIALLIDCSGSMEGDKIRDAKKAAAEFLNNFRTPEGYVGLIGFPGGIIHPLTYDFKAIKIKIRSLDAHNGTPMTMAIDMASQNMLIPTDKSKVIIILSDGLPDAPGSAATSVEHAKKLGIRIITIGVTGADESFLRRIASSPDDFYFCHQSFELENTFVNIATQLSSRSSLKMF